MKIGFDLDNIFINTPPIIPQRIIERLYRGKMNGELKYRYPSKFEQKIREISHASFLRPVVKKNILFVKQLSLDKNYNLYLISSRFSFLQKQTTSIIIKHKLENIFNKLYFNFENNQPHIFKFEKIKKLELDKFVDDDLYLLKYIASRNNKTKLYWLNNKIDKSISKNIRAITKISDVLTD